MWDRSALFLKAAAADSSEAQEIVTGFLIRVAVRKISESRVSGT
jgi:hypothetical protein